MVSSRAFKGFAVSQPGGIESCTRAGYNYVLLLDMRVQVRQSWVGMKPLLVEKQFMTAFDDLRRSWNDIADLGCIRSNVALFGSTQSEA